MSFTRQGKISRHFLLLLLTRISLTTLKFLLLGHPFVKHLKTFIEESNDLTLSSDLDPAKYIFQFSGYPGVYCRKLWTPVCLQVTEDFQPDVIVLIIRTYDLYDLDVLPADLNNSLVYLCDYLQDKFNADAACL